MCCVNPEWFSIRTYFFPRRREIPRIEEKNNTSDFSRYVDFYYLLFTKQTADFPCVRTRQTKLHVLYRKQRVFSIIFDTRNEYSTFQVIFLETRCLVRSFIGFGFHLQRNIVSLFPQEHEFETVGSSSFIYFLFVPILVLFRALCEINNWWMEKRVIR